MGLSTIFERLLGIRRMVDPVFGPLVLRKAGPYSYWEGEVSFAPTGGRVEVFVDADERGPTEAQRGFLRRLADRYPALFAEGLARAERGDPSPEGLDLVWIDIYDDAAQGNFDLTYASADEARHVVVKVSGWTSIDVYALKGE
jgi:hypothetical protein